jgi:hypothetical protein
MRIASFLLLCCATLGADVLVLKSGRKVRGKVVEKGLFYEVTTEAGLRTFTAEEVEDVVTDPKELLGDADAVFESAKSDYHKALELTSAPEQQAAFRAAVEKVTRVREAYAEAADLFPDQDAPAKRLVQVMQLLRLCRERLGSELARAPSAPPAAVPGEASVPPLPAPTAFEVLANPARRADSGARAGARQAFRILRAAQPAIRDLATAAILFLQRSDEEWKLQGTASKAIEEYFRKPGTKDWGGLTPTAHLEAARFLGEQLIAVRKGDLKAATEPLALLAMGHLGCVQGPERVQVASLLGLTLSEGALGNSDGFAVRSLDPLLDEGRPGLAVLAFEREHRQATGPAARYVYGVALAGAAQDRKVGFEKSASVLTNVPSTDPAVRGHLAAMAKSVRDAAVCAGCLGEGKLRCTNCHGVKEIRVGCAKCGGKGRLTPRGMVVTSPKQLAKAGSQCPPCKGTGVEKTFRCEKCKDGSVDCAKCAGPKDPPGLEDLYASSPCRRCEGEGLPFRNVAWACPACLGLGRRLAPKADPVRLLPD